MATLSRCELGIPLLICLHCIQISLVILDSYMDQTGTGKPGK